MSAFTARATVAATLPILSFGRGLRSMLHAMGLVLLLPLFVVFLPIALLYRLVLDSAGWPGWLPQIGAR
jgi:hypothetical protein